MGIEWHGIAVIFSTLYTWLPNGCVRDLLFWQVLTVYVRKCLHMKTYCDIILPSAEGGLYYGKYVDSVPDG